MIPLHVQFNSWLHVQKDISHYIFEVLGGIKIDPKSNFTDPNCISP